MRSIVLAADAPDDRLRAIALYEEGLLAFWQGDDEEACSLNGHSLQLARRVGDPTVTALALCGLARVALHEDLDWARTLCQEALATVEGTDDQLGRANALQVLGVAARMRGDLHEAHRLMAQRIELVPEPGQRGYACASLDTAEQVLSGRLARMASSAAPANPA
jgi:hypothetical protein